MTVNGTQAIVLPPPRVAHLSLRLITTKRPAQFVIYAYFEGIVRKVHPHTSYDTKQSFTTPYQKHTVCGYASS